MTDFGTIGVEFDDVYETITADSPVDFGIIAIEFDDIRKTITAVALTDRGIIAIEFEDDPSYISPPDPIFGRFFPIQNRFIRHTHVDFVMGSPPLLIPPKFELLSGTPVFRRVGPPRVKIEKIRANPPRKKRR